MNEWFLNNISDYWDYASGAIDRNDDAPPDVMTIFRNEAPTPGSTAAVNLPMEKSG